jgi:hypothetical protein
MFKFFYFILNFIVFQVFRKEEILKKISVHNPIFIKAQKDVDFGHYLAGLIDGDGHIDKKNGIIKISFFKLDVSLAYYIKKRLGYGSVHKIKSKNAFNLDISHKLGVEKIVHLINGKIRTENKFNQLKEMLNLNKFLYLKRSIILDINKSNDLENY